MLLYVFRHVDEHPVEIGHKKKSIQSLEKNKVVRVVNSNSNYLNFRIHTSHKNRTL